MKKRGRPQVNDDDRIVSYSEFTAPKVYKKAFEYLASNTHTDKHFYFREALKEYLEKHPIEFFMKLTEEEIVERQGKLTEMQAAIITRDRENRGRAEAFFHKKLDPEMREGYNPGMARVEQLAGQAADMFRQDPEDMANLAELIYMEKKEAYKDRHPKTRYVHTIHT